MNDKPPLRLLNDLPAKKPRQKTGQDAKRWRKLYEWLTTGVASLSIGGSELSRDDIAGLNGTLDKIIDEDYHEQKREAVKKRRKKTKK